MEAGRTHCCNHGRLGVATQALFQRPVEKGRGGGREGRRRGGGGEGREGGGGGEGREERKEVEWREVGGGDGREGEGRGGEGRGGGGGMGNDRISQETKGDQCLIQRVWSPDPPKHKIDN